MMVVDEVALVDIDVLAKADERIIMLGPASDDSFSRPVVLDIHQHQILQDLSDFVTSQHRALDAHEARISSKLGEFFTVATDLPAMQSESGMRGVRAMTSQSTDECSELVDREKSARSITTRSSRRSSPLVEHQTSVASAMGAGARMLPKVLSKRLHNVSVKSNGSVLSWFSESGPRRLADHNNLAPWARRVTVPSDEDESTGRNSELLNLSDSDERYFGNGQQSSVREAYTIYMSTRASGSIKTCPPSSRLFTSQRLHGVSERRTWTSAVLIVQSTWFELFVLLAIVIDAVCIAVASDHFITNATTAYDRRETGRQGLVVEISRPSWIFPWEVAINCFFLFELFIRVLALRGALWAGTDWRWNIFDSLVLAGSTTEIVILMITGSFFSNSIRVLRMVRILRSVRVLRLLQYTPLFSGLQLMLIALTHSSASLVWAILMLLASIFFFALIFVNAVATYISSASVSDSEAEVLRLYFSSLSMTLLTLFMAMSGGIDWWDVVHPLLKIHAVYALLFLLFVLLMVVVVLNIITGAFVNDAVALARKDEDLRMQQELSDSRQLTDRLNALFSEIDKEGTGTFTLDDLLFHLQREEVGMVFTLLGVEVSDAVSFFNLLDQDHSGSVAIEEFVMGCLRLQGRSGMMQMEINIQETGKLVKRSNLVLDDVRMKLLHVEQSVDHLVKTVGVETQEPSRNPSQSPRSRPPVRRHSTVHVSEKGTSSTSAVHGTTSSVTSVFEDTDSTQVLSNSSGLGGQAAEN